MVNDNNSIANQNGKQERAESADRHNKITTKYERAIAELRRELEHRDKEIEKRDRELEHRDKEIEKRDKEIEYRDKEIEKRDKERISVIEYLERRKSAGRWTIIFRDYLKVMSWEEAGFIQLVLDVAKFTTDGVARGLVTEWFRAAQDYMYAAGEFPISTQQDIITRLKTRGFIETRRDGKERSRYIRVVFSEIENAIKEEEIRREKISQPTCSDPGDHARNPDVTHTRNPGVIMPGIRVSPIPGIRVSIDIKEECIKKEGERSVSPASAGETSPRPNTSSSKPKKRAKSSATPANGVPPAAQVADANMFNRESVAPAKKTKAPAICYEWYDRISKAISAHDHLVPMARDNGALYLNDLLEKSGGNAQVIERSVYCFCRLGHRITEPRVRNVKQFCERIDWLDDAMRRKCKELPPSEFMRATTIVDESGRAITKTMPTPDASWVND